MSRRAVALVLAAAAVVLTIVAAVLTRHYTVLLPDRSGAQGAGGLLVGIAVATVAVASVLPGQTEPRGGCITAPLLGFAAFLMGGMIGGNAVLVWLEVYDFRHRPLVPVDAYLRVARYYRVNDKGMSYHLTLADFDADLQLNADEYHRVAGKAWTLPVKDRCVCAQLERSGRAVRVVDATDVRLVSCPAGARHLHLG